MNITVLGFTNVYDMLSENNICDHCGEIYTTHKELLLHKVDIRKKAKKPTLVVSCSC